MSDRVCAILLLATALMPFPCRSEEPEETVHVESIMAQSIELEKKYLAGDMLVSDSAVLAYVSAITQRLVLPEDRKDIRLTVHIIKDQSFNAFATPHGAIYLCSGILGRMENESELAAIIGHEMTHIINDHALIELAQVKRKAHTSTVAGIALDFFIGGFSNIIVSTVFKTAVTGYSRELERQADSMGLVRMRAAGYPPLAFRNMFLKLKAFILEENIKEPFFFSTHPRVEERINNYYTINGNDTVRAGKGDYRQKEFIMNMRPVIMRAAQIDFARGHYSAAKRVAEACRVCDSCATDALVLLGDIARFERDSGSVKAAEEWYEKALSCDQNYRPALRKMGVHLYTYGEKTRARGYLEQYISLTGQANDRDLIETYIRLCADE
jgi:hypothetical protein